MKTYKSDIRRAIHEMASGLHRVGAIDDARMQEYDRSCLTSVGPLGPSDVRALREREAVSQESFALSLGVEPSLVDEWERGERTPGDAELKLLDLVRRKGIEAIQ